MTSSQPIVAARRTENIRYAVRDVVVAHGAGIRRLSSSTTRLEDVFLQAGAEDAPPYVAAAEEAP